MMRLIQTVNMDLKKNRISKIGEVAPEGEEDNDEEEDSLKESFISMENEEQMNKELWEGLNSREKSSVCWKD